MVLAGKMIFIAGPPDVVNEEEAYRHFNDAKIKTKLAEQSVVLEGKRGALLRVVSTSDGKKLAEYKLASLPVWDGTAAAGEPIYSNC